MAVDDHADDRVARTELRALLADAAAGLSDRDRELLDLRLRHDLSTGEVAEVLDVTPDHASVLLGRMRARVERSLGALLVARQGADDCPELAGLLAGWDGRFDPRLRKRVARHVDDCSTCADHRSRALAPSAMLSVAPLLAAPAGLREQIVRSAALPGTPGAHGPGGGGSASAGGGNGPAGGASSRGGVVRSLVTRHGAVAAVVVGVVLLLLGGGAAGSALGLFGPADETDDLALVPVPAIPTPPPGSPPASPTPTPTAAPSPTPTAPTPSSGDGSLEPSPTPPPAPVLAVEPTRLRVPADAATGRLVVSVTDGQVRLDPATDAPWASVDPARADVTPATPVEVLVHVDRADLPEGTATTTLTATGADVEPVVVPLEVAVERPPVVTDVVGEAAPQFGSNDACTGTIVDVGATVADESPLEEVAIVADVDGQSRRATMTPDGDRWYGTLTAPPGTATIAWVVEATDARGNTATSERRVTRGRC